MSKLYRPGVDAASARDSGLSDRRVHRASVPLVRHVHANTHAGLESAAQAALLADIGASLTADVGVGPARTMDTSNGLSAPATEGPVTTARYPPPPTAVRAVTATLQRPIPRRPGLVPTDRAASPLHAADAVQNASAPAGERKAAPARDAAGAYARKMAELDSIRALLEARAGEVEAAHAQVVEERARLASVHASKAAGLEEVKKRLEATVSRMEAKENQLLQEWTRFEDAKAEAVRDAEAHLLTLAQTLAAGIGVEFSAAEFQLPSNAASPPLLQSSDGDEPLTTDALAVSVVQDAGEERSALQGARVAASAALLARRNAMLASASAAVRKRDAAVGEREAAVAAREEALARMLDSMDALAAREAELRASVATLDAIAAARAGDSSSHRQGAVVPLSHALSAWQTSLRSPPRAGSTSSAPPHAAAPQPAAPHMMRAAVTSVLTGAAVDAVLADSVDVTVSSRAAAPSSPRVFSDVAALPALHAPDSDANMRAAVTLLTSLGEAIDGDDVNEPASADELHAALRPPPERPDAIHRAALLTPSFSDKRGGVGGPRVTTSTPSHATGTRAATRTLSSPSAHAGDSASSSLSLTRRVTLTVREHSLDAREVELMRWDANLARRVAAFLAFRTRECDALEAARGKAIAAATALAAAGKAEIAQLRERALEEVHAQRTALEDYATSLAEERTSLAAARDEHDAAVATWAAECDRVRAELAAIRDAQRQRESELAHAAATNVDISNQLDTRASTFAAEIAEAHANLASARTALDARNEEVQAFIASADARARAIEREAADVAASERATVIAARAAAAAEAEVHSRDLARQRAEVEALRSAAEAKATSAAHDSEQAALALQHARAADEAASARLAEAHVADIAAAARVRDIEHAEEALEHLREELDARAAALEREEVTAAAREAAATDAWLQRKALLDQDVAAHERAAAALRDMRSSVESACAILREETSRECEEARDVVAAAQRKLDQDAVALTEERERLRMRSADLVIAQAACDEERAAVAREAAAVALARTAADATTRDIDRASARLERERTAFETDVALRDAKLASRELACSEREAALQLRERAVASGEAASVSQLLQQVVTLTSQRDAATVAADRAAAAEAEQAAAFVRASDRAADASAEAAAHQRELVSLRAALAEERTARSSMSSLAATRERECVGLRADLDAAIARASAADTACSHASVARDAAERGWSSARDALTSLQATLASRDADLTAARATVVTLQTDINTARVELVAESARLQAAMLALEQHHAAAVDALTHVSSAHASMHVHLREQSSASRDVVDATSASLREAQADNAALRTSLAATIRALEESNAHARSLEAVCGDLTHDHEAALKDAQTAHEAAAAAQARVQEVLSQLTAANAIAAAATMEKEVATQRAVEALDVARAARDEVVLLRAAAAEASTALQQARRDADATATALQEKSRRAESRVIELEATLTTQKASYLQEKARMRESERTATASHTAVCAERDAALSGKKRVEEALAVLAQERDVAMQAAMSTHARAIEEANLRCVDAEARLDESMRAHAVARDEITRASETILALQQACRDAEAAAALLRSDLRQRTSELESLRTQAGAEPDSTDTSAAAAASHISSLQADIRRLHEALRDAEATATRARVAEAELSSVQAQIADMRIHAESSENALRDARAAHREVAMQLAAARESNEAMTRDVAAARTECVDLQAAQNATAAQLEAAMSQVSTLREALVHEKSRTAAAAKRADELDERVRALSQHCSDLEIASTRAQSAAQRADGDARSHTEAATHAAARQRALETELTAAQQAHGASVMAMHAAQETAASADMRAVAAEQACSSLRAHISDLEAALSAYKRTSADAASSDALSRAALLDAEQRFQDARAEAAAATVRAAEAASERNTLVHRAAELEASCTSARERAVVLESGAAAALQRALDAEVRAEALQAEATDARASAAALAHELASARRLLSDSTHRLEQAVNQCSDAEQAAAQSSSRVATLMHDCETLQARLNAALATSALPIQQGHAAAFVSPSTTPAAVAPSVDASPMSVSALAVTAHADPAHTAPVHATPAQAASSSDDVLCVTPSPLQPRTLALESTVRHDLHGRAHTDVGVAVPPAQVHSRTETAPAIMQAANGDEHNPFAASPEPATSPSGDAHNPFASPPVEAFAPPPPPHEAFNPFDAHPNELQVPMQMDMHSTPLTPTLARAAVPSSDHPLIFRDAGPSRIVATASVTELSHASPHAFTSDMITRSVHRSRLAHDAAAVSRELHTHAEEDEPPPEDAAASHALPSSRRLSGAGAVIAAVRAVERAQSHPQLHSAALPPSTARGAPESRDSASPVSVIDTARLEAMVDTSVDGSHAVSNPGVKTLGDQSATNEEAVSLRTPIRAVQAEYSHMTCSLCLESFPSETLAAHAAWCLERKKSHASTAAPAPAPSTSRFALRLPSSFTHMLPRSAAKKEAPATTSARAHGSDDSAAVSGGGVLGGIMSTFRRSSVHTPSLEGPTSGAPVPEHLSTPVSMPPAATFVSPPLTQLVAPRPGVQGAYADVGGGVMGYPPNAGAAAAEDMGVMDVDAMRREIALRRANTEQLRKLRTGE